jgi:hypothetical protein
MKRKKLEKLEDGRKDLDTAIKDKEIGEIMTESLVDRRSCCALITGE